jgi:hypothetical protein
MFSPLHFVCLETEENEMELEIFFPFVLARMRMMSPTPVNETYTIGFCLSSAVDC